MPVHFTQGAPPGFRPITEGEPAREGDKYTSGKVTGIVGTDSTYLKHGMPWPHELMCYNPVRRKDPR